MSLFLMKNATAIKKTLMVIFNKVFGITFRERQKKKSFIIPTYII